LEGTVAGFVNEQFYTAYSPRFVHRRQMSQAVEYLRAQAERCLRLAKTCTNASAAESLTIMAANSLERADEMESGAMGHQFPQEA